MRFKKGQLIALTHSEYDDFTYAGTFIILKGFLTSKIIERFFDEDPQRLMKMSENLPEFVNWLEDHHYIAEAKCKTWHFGDYELSVDSIPRLKRKQRRLILKAKKKEGKSNQPSFFAQTSPIEGEIKSAL